MHSRGQKSGDKIFILGIKVNNADSSAFLFFVFIGICPLDISSGSKHEDSFFVRNQVFVGQRLRSLLHDFSPPLIAVFFFYRFELVFYYIENFFWIGQNIFEDFDKNLDSLELVFNFFSFQSGEFLKLHFQNCDSLPL